MKEFRDKVAVDTRVLESERNRPEELQNVSASESAHPAVAQALEMLHRIVSTGMQPSKLAEAVFDAIRDERFYILTHADWKQFVRKRMDDILRERNPC